MLGLRHALGLAREQQRSGLPWLAGASAAWPASRAWWQDSAFGLSLNELGAVAGSEAARAAQALASELYGLGKVRRVPGKGELDASTPMSRFAPPI